MTGGRRGDQLHIVAPATNPLKDNIESIGKQGSQWGAKIINRKGIAGKEAVEYVFYNRSGVTDSYTDKRTNVYFKGIKGYASPHQIALFQGTEIRYGDLAIRKEAMDDFGISAEVTDGKVTGRYTGKRGATGTVSITLPAGFTTHKPKVDIVADADVIWNVTTHTVTFTINAITRQNDIKDYTITPQ